MLYKDVPQLLKYLPNYEAIFMWFLGDVRLNQSPLLALESVILLREHNRIANKLSKINPHWDDEKVFQTARNIAIGMFQHISFEEFLPAYISKAILYHNNVLYKNEGFVDDYDVKVDPAAYNDFSNGAFRQIHSMVAGSIE